MNIVLLDAKSRNHGRMECLKIAEVDSCAAGGTCQPLAAEGFELQSSAPAELFGRQGSELHGVGNNIRQWVGHPVPPVSYTNVQVRAPATAFCNWQEYSFCNSHIPAFALAQASERRHLSSF